VLPVAQETRSLSDSPRRGVRVTPPAGLFKLHRNHLSNVLILGGSAEQRIHVAFSFHHYSQLSGGPFVSIDCAYESQRLGSGLEAWLGGYSQPADDPIRTAAKGTLFLDSIASLTLDIQRLLQAFTRRDLDGMSNSTCRWGGRLVVGNQAPLAAPVRAGRFLSELYDSLDKVRLELRSPGVSGLPVHASRSQVGPTGSRTDRRG